MSNIVDDRKEFLDEEGILPGAMNDRYSFYYNIPRRSFIDFTIANSSEIDIPPLFMGGDLFITFYFRFNTTPIDNVGFTTAADGTNLIFYNEAGGTITVRYGPSSSYSFKSIGVPADGEFHKFSMSIYGTDLTILVDDLPVTTDTVTPSDFGIGTLGARPGAYYTDQTLADFTFYDFNLGTYTKYTLGDGLSTPSITSSTGGVTRHKGQVFGDSLTNNMGDIGAPLGAVIGAPCTTRGIAGANLNTIKGEFNTYVPNAGDSYVIIQGGINDITAASTDPNASIRGHILDMVNGAMSNGLDYCVVTVSPFKGWSTWNTDRQTWADSFADWVVQAFPSNHLDLRPVLGDSADIQTLDSSLDSGDGLHPNGTGYTKANKALGENLSRLAASPTNVAQGTANGAASGLTEVDSNKYKWDYTSSTWGELELVKVEGNPPQP